MWCSFWPSPDLPALATVSDRVVDTLLGGGIALAAYLAWPTWESRLVGPQLSRLLEAQCRYAAAVLQVVADAASDERRSIAELRTAARLESSNAEASVERVRSEPARGREGALPAATAASVLAAARKLTLAVLTLHAHLPRTRGDGAPDARRPCAGHHRIARRCSETAPSAAGGPGGGRAAH